MKLASRLITLLIVLTTLQVSGQDTIWTNSNKVVPCKVITLINGQTALSTKFEGGYSKIDLESIERFSWGGKLFFGNQDWRELDCEKLPYIEFSENNDVIFEKEFDTGKHSPRDIFDVLKIENDWKGLVPYSTITQNKNGTQIDLISSYSQIVENKFGNEQTVSVGLYTSVYFSSTKINVSCRATSIQSYSLPIEKPVEILKEGYRKKNGKVKEANFLGCLQTNNAISGMMQKIEEVLDFGIDYLNRIDELRELRTTLNQYYEKNITHPVEGIWSADILYNGNQRYNQAFDIAIIRDGYRFDMIPLILKSPSFDLSHKVMEPTADPNVLLLEATFLQNDNISAGTRFTLESPTRASFNLQVPEKRLIEYLNKQDVSVPLKYIGNNTVRYSLIKKLSSKSPDTDDTGKHGWSGSGSGFSITTDGLVVTNYHVVKHAEKIFIRGVNGDYVKSLEAELLKYDEENDLAIIRITDSDFQQLPDLPYNISTSEIQVGTEVFSLGFPKPKIFGSSSPNFQDGRISSTVGTINNGSRYQMTVRITKGNSGGPIFDQIGNVIGVSVGGYFNPEYMNATECIKSDYLIRLLNQITDYAPTSKEPSTTSLEDQIEAYKNFVYLIEVSSEQ